MNEDFLHYIWQLSHFDVRELRTSRGEELQIIKKGFHNTNAGPDFSDARIKVGDTTWAGNVEIHTKSSDWERHNHTSDKNYDTIVLHVVYEDDKPVKRSNGEYIPTLELKNRIPGDVYGKYLYLMGSKTWIPCSKEFEKLDNLFIKFWLNRMLVERLERKSGEVSQSLENLNNDLEEAFYIQLAGNFGFKINTEPFKRLARALPYKIIAKHRYSLLQIEALLFGQAGLLESAFNDEYPTKLQNEYKVLKAKFGLTPIPAHNWKFMRTRPYNFPTIRLSQLASLLHKQTNLFSSLLEANSIAEIKKVLEVSASEYWKNHYQFDKESKASSKSLGESAIENIIINTVVPFLFAYAEFKGDGRFKDQTLKLLDDVPAEKNNITDGFGRLGYKATSAAQSQALIELKNEFCNHKKCLNCGIANQFLRVRE